MWFRTHTAPVFFNNFEVFCHFLEIYCECSPKALTFLTREYLTFLFQLSRNISENFILLIQHIYRLCLSNHYFLSPYSQFWFFSILYNFLEYCQSKYWKDLAFCFAIYFSSFVVQSVPYFIVYSSIVLFTIRPPSLLSIKD